MKPKQSTVARGIRRAALVVVSDWPGLFGLALLAEGVRREFGLPWTLILVGAVLFAVYLARELRALRRS